VKGRKVFEVRIRRWSATPGTVIALTALVLSMLRVAIDLPVDIPVALDHNDSMAFHVLDKIRFPVFVGIDRYLILIAAHAPGPLVGTTLAAAMSSDAVSGSVAGEQCES